MDREIWKDIAGYEGLYQVSEYGNVKSLYYQGKKREKILKPTEDDKGYLFVNLWKNRKSKSMKIHRLVAQVFISNFENKPQVNHIDGCKTNNCISNLEWCTKSENEKHAYKTGLKKAKRGENNGQSKLAEKDVLKIRELYKTGNYLQRELANIFGVSRRNIGDIINNKTWKHI